MVYEMLLWYTMHYTQTAIKSVRCCADVGEQHVGITCATSQHCRGHTTQPADANEPLNTDTRNALNTRRRCNKRRTVLANTDLRGGTVSVHHNDELSGSDLDSP